MSNCSECGSVLRENTAFCSNCGKKIEVKERALFCTQCGNKLGCDALFCDSCGARIDDDVSPVSVPPANTSSGTGGCLLLSLEGLSLYKGKQPIGILNIYTDRVEFVHSGRNFMTSAMVSGIIGAMLATGTSKTTDVIDCFPMNEIAAANKSKHPKISSYVELVLKNGTTLKYLDRAAKHSTERMFSAVDAINAQL